MSIRTIKKNGVVVGYQAIAGDGGAGWSIYVPAAAPDALSTAEALSADLVSAHKASRPQRKRDPLTGLRLALHPRKGRGAPLLYAEAMWRKNGMPVHRSYSAGCKGRGPLAAIALAMRAMENGTGHAISATPAQVLSELSARFERSITTRSNA